MLCLRGLFLVVCSVVVLVVVVVTGLLVCLVVVIVVVRMVDMVFVGGFVVSSSRFGGTGGRLLGG